MAKRAGQRKKLATVDKLLGVPSTEGCLDIEVARIRPFKDHPFKVKTMKKCISLLKVS